MKIYRRNSDGFEVHDEKNRSIEWAVETYGGEFVEIVHTPTIKTDVEIAKEKEIQAKKEALAKSDYKILKKLEKLLPADDVDILERQSKRDRINALEIA